MANPVAGSGAPDMAEGLLNGSDLQGVSPIVAAKNEANTRARRIKIAIILLPSSESQRWRSLPGTSLPTPGGGDMSENTPEFEEPDVEEPQPDRAEPLKVSEPVFDIIEKGDQHDYETREPETETKERG